MEGSVFWLLGEPEQLRPSEEDLMAGEIGISRIMNEPKLGNSSSGASSYFVFDPIQCPGSGSSKFRFLRVLAKNTRQKPRQKRVFLILCIFSSLLFSYLPSLMI